MEIFSFCYNSISEGMSRRLNDLISSVWGNVEGKPLHLRELNAMSFCAADGAKVVGYAGDLVVAKKSTACRVCDVPSIVLQWLKN